MPLPGEERYTYADLLAWNTDQRYELIDGQAYLLASPSSTHQRIITELVRQIGNYLDGKRCEVFASPMDVRLFSSADEQDSKTDTVVIPDLSVICDPSKIDQRGCKGAPDMTVEVLSPSTQRMDRVFKLNLYQRAGVKEYWLVDPLSKTVQVFWLENGLYRIVDLYSETDIVKVNALDSCFVELSKVFRF